MMQLYLAVRINEYVASQLLHIAAGSAHAASFGQKLDIDPPGLGTIDLPPMAAFHPVGLVESACFIDHQGPMKIRILHIGLRNRPDFEGHHDYFDVEFYELFFLITQLRDVFLTGQSGKVPMEYHQQPTASVVIERMFRALGVGKIEIYCGRPTPVYHSGVLCYDDPLGLEAAQAALGHSDIATNQIYAEVDHSLAIKIARERG